MAITTKQKGIAVCIDGRPGFSGYINTDFPEQRKAREQAPLIGEEGKAVTELAVDLTDEVSAKLVVKVPPPDGDTPVLPTLPEVFDVLNESAADVATGAAVRHWLVLEVGRPRKAGMELLVDLKLKRSEGVDLTL